MPALPFRHAIHAIPLLAALSALPVLAQQHAHTHGRLSMDVAVDAQTLTLAIESPLDSFLGFERAPRTDAERKRVSDMVARLNAADRLFQPDPAAECTLSKVTLNSAALGLGDAKQEDDHGHGHDGKKGHDQDEHADIDVDIVFNCAKATQASYVDVKLFDAFKHIRAIDAQVAGPQGQFKRGLRPDASRLKLGH
ncbi:DUF2796 domain-containing protein [Hylemonella gracilis]|uniref:DUF2796 domain-containing protein n=1 Tax=Hylemonella gracilis TaxID=80880 RepID=A0A4P6UP97_9BURK|nr:DUF2796 domain-containing protein [Hylemonella gracilis]QBK06120.1 DUF2796 domain-containing protein [Hylemonella gracilis]